MAPFWRTLPWTCSRSPAQSRLKSRRRMARHRRVGYWPASAREEGTEIKLVANEDYWERTKVKNVIVRVIPDDSARFWP